MLYISQGYKQGRAVMFYDLTEMDGNCARKQVPKDEVVKMCTDGQIGNAKIQWWEGKPIVRCDNKKLPLLKLDNEGNIIGAAAHAVRSGEGSNKSVTVHMNETPVTKELPKSTVVGKLSTKKPKRNTAFDGYNVSNLVEKQEAKSCIDLSGLSTIGDMFDYIAKDFGVRRVDVYKAEFAKKYKIEKPISGINSMELQSLQSSIATYLMNMVYEEIEGIYSKYFYR